MSLTGWVAEHGVPSHEDMTARFTAARVRVAAAAHRTPVLTSRQLDEAAGARVYLKCENLQRVGAFKFRGAWNFMGALSSEQRSRGIVTYSSGNHAQAAALSCRLHGVPCTVAMPSFAPAAKRAATAGYGATILHYDQMGETRDGLAARLARERGATLMAPYDHPEIIVGQGTAAAELLEDSGPLDAILVPVGGGGLLSGSALAAALDGRGTRVIGVEPETGDDAGRSFRSGVLQSAEHPDTICDGARTPSLSDLTFAFAQRYAHDFTSCSDAEVVCALRFLWERTKLVVEPTGALAVAALLAGKVELEGRRVGLILSGGNADLAQAAAWFGA